eukprot:CAMPEP_0116884536 /NCGR_PEP_ID=MMETSP0463-20121206/17479_1 /TAXON_ID=181622 /ORGANISM="Strombidinopsis sp, Strain SopsisLIS2011" /LENGTH=88 /DNA_ID=CAMNT_0004541241 /DNA_START=358 /DNA_END=624 /DNA_ORIENTATION=+
MDMGFNYQKTKLGVEPYFVTYDEGSFPTMVKNKVDKRRNIDWMFVNNRGKFVCLAPKRGTFVTFRDEQTLKEEKRLNLSTPINILAQG